MNAVIIPIYKENLDIYEILSLEQCFSVLGGYKIIFVTYPSLNISNYNNIIENHNLNVEFQFFDLSYFKNIDGYNHLLTSFVFYARFAKYKYILIYQPDAYVFKDELEKWCLEGFDYIGAPWFDGWGEATKDSKFTGVGNGGFSLRKVSTALEVWSWRSYFKIRRPFKELWLEMVERNKSLVWYRKIGSFKYFVLQFLGKNNNTKYFLQFCYGNEDVFWTEYIPKYFKKFKVAPIEDALQFSFETNPSKLYKMNKNRLPFGCHAWMKYEFEEFWINYIEINK